MKKVYFVRHGETTHNLKGLVQDGTPLLTELGGQQAEVVADRLRHLNFSHLIVSDYERTKQTAAPVARLTGMTPVYTPLFREIRRPSVFFHTERAAAAYQDFMKMSLEKFNSDPAWRHFDEENFEDTIVRATKALEYVQSLEDDVVVVSHGHFIRFIVALVGTDMQLDGPMWSKMIHSFHAVNTGITTLQYDESADKWQILTFNDIAHFAE